MTKRLEIYKCDICGNIVAVSYTHLDVYKRQGLSFESTEVEISEEF